MKEGERDVERGRERDVERERAREGGRGIDAMQKVFFHCFFHASSIFHSPLALLLQEEFVTGRDHTNVVAEVERHLVGASLPGVCFF